METAATINLTYYEAVLVDWIDRALAAGRINRDSPTFTGRGLAVAVEGLSGVMSRPNEREIGVLLDRMGVFLFVKFSRRKTPDLLKALPDWREAAKAKRVCERELMFPELSPHSNITR